MNVVVYIQWFWLSDRGDYPTVLHYQDVGAFLSFYFGESIFEVQA